VRRTPNSRSLFYAAIGEELFLCMPT